MTDVGLSEMLLSTYPGNSRYPVETRPEEVQMKYSFSAVFVAGKGYCTSPQK
jgi:hypothetical protein